MQQLKQKLEAKVSAQAKKIDVLEASETELKSQVHRLINEKLALINGTPRESTEVNGEQQEMERAERQAPTPKGAGTL